MKTKKRFALSAFSAVALLALGAAAPAQYETIGDDGIVASPKLRQLLNERRVVVTTDWDSQTVGYEATGPDGITASPKMRQFLTDQTCLAVWPEEESYTVGYVPTGADGITASPKLRQMLDERSAQLPPYFDQSNED